MLLLLLMLLLLVMNRLLFRLMLIYIISRGGMIHRCIDALRYFSRDTYRDIIFHNRNFFFFFTL